jgi:PhnB protein
MASKTSGKSSKGSKGVAKGGAKGVAKAARKPVKKAASKVALKSTKGGNKLSASKAAAPSKAKPKAPKKVNKAQKLLKDVAMLARSARKKIADVIDTPDDNLKLKSITPFLSLKGAQDAIEFYKQAFDAEERYRMPNPDGTLMHAEIVIGDSRIMLAEATEAPESKSTMHLLVDDCDSIFEKAVAAGAQERRSPSDQFWGERIGEIEDPFGIVWSIATQVEKVAPEELSRRAEEFLANNASASNSASSALPPPSSASDALSTAE